LKIAAPAKINLTLEVTGIEENGYHTLDTLFSWIELEDILSLEQADSTTLEVSGDFGSPDLVSEDNLILKAHRAVEARAGRRLPTRYKVEKRIPPGGGLGGGSADAAATLFGLNELYELGLTPEELMELARPLGADVAFGLVGGVARGTRYGDLLEPVPALKELAEWPLVLVFPPFGCPTPKVYGAWDREPVRARPGATRKFLEASTAPDQVGMITNDLQEPAFSLFPSLRELSEGMKKIGLQGVCLSGSGSTLFGFIPPKLDRLKVEQSCSALGSRWQISRLKEARRFEFVS